MIFSVKTPLVIHVLQLEKWSKVFFLDIFPDTPAIRYLALFEFIPVFLVRASLPAS